MLAETPAVLANPALFLQRMQREFGNVVQFPVPGPSYLVTGGSDLRELLVSSYRDYDKRTAQYQALATLTGQGLLAAPHSTWRSQRPAVQPAFDHRHLASLVEPAEAEAEVWVRNWRGRPAANLQRAADHYSLRVLSRYLFGSADPALVEEVLSATHAGLEGALNQVRLRGHGPVGSHARSKLDRAVARLLDGAPDTAFTAGLLRNASREETEAQVRTFLIAGHETVASSLIWTLALLAGAPHWQTLLRADPDDEDLLRRVMHESLRLFPPAWVITRRTERAVTLSGFELPAGALVIASPFVSQRDPDTWQQPSVFDPNRSQWDRGAPLGFIPFGAGPRLCIGRDFTSTVTSIALRALVQQFSFRLVRSPGLRAGVVLRPRRSVDLLLSRA